MKIVGIGLDLVKISRVRDLADTWQDRFLDRVYSPAERDYCLARAAPYASLAGRFAAKEAILKALGTGWSRGIRWQDIEVLNDQAGRPRAVVGGRAAALLREAGVTAVHVSLSHDTDYAVAEAILTSDG